MEDKGKHGDEDDGDHEDDNDSTNELFYDSLHGRWSIISTTSSYIASIEQDQVMDDCL